MEILSKIIIGVFLLPLFMDISQAQETPVDLTQWTLEQLTNTEVTLASKKPEKIFEVSAAIFVITSEDIRRSGCTSIAEVLRMVPGMEVARIDANKWAVSCRGFNNRFANKLLVLIDGRSVYTPVFSGVFWETQEVLLEDVARIEVIRGPGATLWGANAVNGVINIITRRAQDTQGGLLTLGVGSEERAFGSVRYGGNWRDEVYYRLYARYFNRDNFVYASGEEMADDWDALQGGFRLDWEVSGSNSLTIQGDVYHGDVGQMYSIIDSTDQLSLRTFDFDTDIAGGNLLGRWQHSFSHTSDMTLQLYYDWTERKEAVVEGIARTFDLDFQHRFSFGGRQEMVWGLGYRFMKDKIDGSFTVSFNPDRRSYQLISAFLQDEITLVEDRLRMTFGSKFEHNDYSGVEIQPTVRWLWLPYRQHSLWAAVSRAVRTPSRADHDIRGVIEASPSGLVYPRNLTILAAVNGNRNFESEELLAYELGYRAQPTNRLFLDLAAFYNVYDKLRTIELGTPLIETSPSPPHVTIPACMDNKMYGETYGVELVADWRMLDWWRLRATYTYLKMQLHLYEGSKDTYSKDTEGVSPNHQFSFQCSMDLPWRLKIDLRSRYMDDLPSLNVRSYHSLDIRLGWKRMANLEVSLVGQNLLRKHHPEFTVPVGLNLSTRAVTSPAEVEQGVSGAITWKF